MTPEAARIPELAWHVRKAYNGMIMKIPIDEIKSSLLTTGITNDETEWIITEASHQLKYVKKKQHKQSNQTIYIGLLLAALAILALEWFGNDIAGYRRGQGILAIIAAIISIFQGINSKLKVIK